MLTYGKSIKEDVYCGICGMYKGNKAFFIFNSDLLDYEKFSYTEQYSILLKPSLNKLIDDGRCRVIPTKHFNPVRNGYWAAGINMHNGPAFKYEDWNYSLGCITVEPKTFQVFMKTIKKDQLIVYIHNLDQLSITNEVKENKFKIDRKFLTSLNNYSLSILSSVRDGND